MKKRRGHFSPTAQDLHHICYTRRGWSQGYARALREHPFCKVYIPRDTLHRAIHVNLSQIPAPEGNDAKRVFEYLMRLERAGQLDYAADILERLDFLIAHLETSTTVEALKKQRGLVEQYKPR